MKLVKRSKGKIIIVGNKKFKYLETFPKLHYFEKDCYNTELSNSYNGIYFYVSSVEEREEIYNLFKTFGFSPQKNKTNNRFYKKEINPIYENPIRGENTVLISTWKIEERSKLKKLIGIIRKELGYKIRYNYINNLDIII